MACKGSSKQEWSHEDLDKAFELSKRRKYINQDCCTELWNPKSTLHDHCSGKVKGSKCGPPTILSNVEELKLAAWAMEMASIGYGHTRVQMSEMVKRLLDEDGRPNPFVDNYPGCDWWYGFLRRRPEISLCPPEQLKLSRASTCSQERLSV